MPPKRQLQVDASSILADELPPKRTRSSSKKPDQPEIKKDVLPRKSPKTKSKAKTSSRVKKEPINKDIKEEPMDFDEPDKAVVQQDTPAIRRQSTKKDVVEKKTILKESEKKKKTKLETEKSPKKSRRVKKEAINGSLTDEPKDGKIQPDSPSMKKKKSVKKEIVDKKTTKAETVKSTKTKSGKGKDIVIKQAIQRTFVKKGKAPVDGHCPIASTSHVYWDDEDIWDCMLNQTNIQFNNNKYYLMQLLQDDTKKVFTVWMRWGRVGANGQNSLHPCGPDLEKAKKIFTKKFSDKTKNDWTERECFEKVPGKYDLLKMDYNESKTDAVEEKAIVKKEKVKVECQLEKHVQTLIELICDIKAMEQAVVEMKYDAKKAPLGKLTSDQVKAGYQALKDIDNCISGSGKTSNRDLLQACNDFYTRIPHYFGMKVPPMIRTKADVKEKMSLLEALADIQAAMNVIGKIYEDDTHPTDHHYKDLACDITALKKSSSEFQLLEKYMVSTHGFTHTMYDLSVEEIFAVSKSMESERFKDVGQRTLLWHGSRLTNWAGILSQGLRIAPPEAPSTGYMFGKGIYFADMSTKSANYCNATNRNNTGILVLCEVSLGKCKELLQADYRADKLPKGYHSVKGCGKTAPKTENSVKMDGDVIVPMGPAATLKGSESKGYGLQYNEYIVYNADQVKIKYLFKVKFNFKF